MDEEEHLSFFLDWYDPQSQQVKPYLLHYYGDNTLELIERKTRRTFLKRIHIPTVSLNNLFIGASLSIYSRQLTIIEAANTYTQQYLQNQNHKATFVITPPGYRNMGRVITLIEKSGLQLLNTVMVQLSATHVKVLETQGYGLSGIDCTRDVSLLIEVKYEISQPMDAVRSSLSAANLNNVVIVLDCGLEQLPALQTTAVLDNCSLCLIRPRIVREGRVGEIVEDILSAGFEISALKSLHLRVDEADELFRVYKGVYRQYQEVIKYMSSTPCIALEIRGENVVTRFREFCGPLDVQIAKTLRPSSLRAKYGKNTMYNAVHCTDCPEDGVLESQFVFTSLC